MKKVFIIIIILLVSISFCDAQHIVTREDTQYQFLPSCCDYPDWTYETVSILPNTECFIPFHYTEQPLTIYGISILVRRGGMAFTQAVDMIVCQKRRDGESCRIAMIDSVRFSAPEENEILKRRKRMIFNSFNYRGVAGSGWQIEPTYDTLPLLDFYFPHPVTVTDTFYAGFQTISRCNGSEFGSCLEYLLEAYCSCWEIQPGLMYWNAGTEGWDVPPELENYISFYNLHPITRDTMGKRMLIYLIVEPPTLDSSDCITPPAPELLYTDSESGLVSLQLQVNQDSTEHHLAIGKWPTHPDSCDIRILPAARIFENISGLDTGCYYAVWDRNECGRRFTFHTDTSYWTDWSEPLIFYLGTEPDTTAPDPGDDTVVLVHAPSPSPIRLYPNPTSGVLTVDCSQWPATHLEVLDLQGRILLQQPTLDTPVTTLDIHHLSAGSYILKVSGPQGTTIKPFIRQ